MKPKPIPTLTPDEIESFWLRVDKRNPDGCWPWTSYLNANGYGTFRPQRRQHLYPHRVAYVLSFGPIPEGLTIDHVKERGCTMKSCCNPYHLEAISQSDNIKRYHKQRVRKQCEHGLLRHGPAKCKDCNNAYMRAYQMEWRRRKS